MVIVLPVYEQEQPGVLYNTAAVIDADGTYLGKYRKHHIPQLHGFWEKFYFRPGNLGFPVFDTAVGKVGVYICYDRHFPEGWRALGLDGAQIVFNPSATSRGLSAYLWQLEQPAAAVANEYFVGAINRVGVEELGDDDFYGTSYFVDPRGQLVGDVGARDKRAIWSCATSTSTCSTRCATVGVLPRPPSRRLRRPDPAVSRLYRQVVDPMTHADQGRHGRDRDRRRTIADVLIDGETIAAAARARHDAARRGLERRRRRSSTPRASTSSRAASTRTRTWRCRSAARTRVGHLRDRHAAPRRGAARRRSSTSPSSAGRAVLRRPGRLARKGRRQLRDRLRLPP